MLLDMREVGGRVSVLFIVTIVSSLGAAMNVSEE